MILACCQVLLSFAEQPLSHGPALCMVTWGMYFLLRWWQTESIWRGTLAGLCLGYAVSIRYTEGLLLIPLAAGGTDACSSRRTMAAFFSPATLRR